MKNNSVNVLTKDLRTVPVYLLKLVVETMFLLKHDFKMTTFIRYCGLFFRSQKLARKLFLLIVSFTSGP